MDDTASYDAYLVNDPDDGSWLGFILDLPGCVGEGHGEQETLDALRAAVPDYFAWLRSHDEYTPDVRGPWRVATREVYRMRVVDGHPVSSFFDAEAQPIDDQELDWGLAVLGWAQQDLLAVAEALPAAALDAPAPDGGWTARRVIEHVADSQRWYVTRIEAAPVDPAPPAGDPLAELRAAFAASIPRLRAASPEERAAVREHDGDRWSLRKVLRRSVWHARDHTGQLRQLLGG